MGSVLQSGVWRTLLAVAILGAVASSCGTAPEDDDTTPASSPTLAPTPTQVPSPTVPPTPMPTRWVSRATGYMDFWTHSNLDLNYGGYFTQVNRAGTVSSSDKSKWTRSLSREIYGFVRAFQLTGDLSYLDSARLGVDWMLEYALDPVNGGFYQKLSPSGAVLQDSRALFDQVYALTGLVAWLEVTGDPVVKALVTSTYQQLDEKAWDTNFGGYYNALDTDMSTVIDDRKAFNPQVDTATAYLLNLYAATGDPAYKSRLESLGFVLVSQLIDPDGAGWIGEMFDSEWNYLPDEVPYGEDRSICGHNLKVVWTLTRLHLLTGSSIFLSEAEELLGVAFGPCRDRLLGGIYDQVERSTSTVVAYDNNPVNADQKPWWQQEQGMFATQLLLEVTGKTYYEAVWLETRDFYLRYHQDTTYGEVFATVYGDGRPKDTTKGNPDKSAYHSMETAYLSYLYDSFFTTKTPVTLYYRFEPAEVDRIQRLAPIEVPYGTYTIDDPVAFGEASLALDTPSQVIIPAGQGGTLSVIYRPQ